MATYRVSVVDENFRPQHRVTVEAVSLNNWPDVTETQITDTSGSCQFTNITGPHFFRPRVQRRSGTVGKKVFTGRVQVQTVGLGEAMNVDYVVDSNGMGTHTALFGTSGALGVAIATGVSKTIWVCSTHSESITATHDLPALALNQKIIVKGAGPYRPTLAVHADLSTAAVMTHQTGNSGANSYLRFEGLEFSRSSSVSAGPVFTGDGGFDTPKLEFVDIHWLGTNWNYLLWFRGGTSSDIEDILFDRNIALTAITSLIATSSSASSVGKFVVQNCDWVSLGTVFERAASTDVDPGLEGIIIEGNIFRAITSYIWQRTQNWPFSFRNNIVLDYTPAASMIDIGTAGTTSPVDVTIAGNTVYCSNNNAATTAFRVQAGAGTAANITIMGNSLRGPGGGVAITLDVAQTNSVVLNSYRAWTTNVGGSVGPSAGVFTGDHGGLTGLTDDDHTQYALLAGRAAGQTLIGGTAASEDLILESTAHATKGRVATKAGSFFHVEEDANFSLGFAGTTAYMYWDATDYIAFERAANTWKFASGGAEGIHLVGATGAQFAGYGYFGGAGVSPTNTTAGDLSAKRLHIWSTEDSFPAGSLLYINAGTTSNQIQIHSPALGAGTISLGQDSAGHGTFQNGFANGGMNIVSGGGATTGIVTLVNTPAWSEGLFRLGQNYMRFLTGGATTRLYMDAAGQLEIPTTGAGAGILMGGDVQLYRGAANRLDIPDSETVLTYLRVGANAAPTNVTAGDITATRLFITDAALDSEARLLQVIDTYTPGAGTFNTLYSQVNVDPPVGLGTDDIRAGKFEVNVRPTANYVGGVVGFYSEADHDSGAFNVDTVRGFFAQALQRVAATTVAVLNGGQVAYRAAAGDVTTAVSLDVLRGWPGDAGTITNGIGLRIQAHGAPTPTLDLAIQSLSGEHRFVGDTKMGANTAPAALLDLGDGAPGDNFALLKFHTSRAWQFETDGADGVGQKLALRGLADNKNFNIQSVGATKVFEVIVADAGGSIGFFGTTPATQAAAYTPTNVVTDRSYDANATSIAELADVVGTLIADLQTYGLLQ